MKRKKQIHRMIPELTTIGREVEQGLLSDSILRNAPDIFPAILFVFKQIK